MTIFGHGTSDVLNSRTSPVLSPNRWALNGKGSSHYLNSDVLGSNDQSLFSSRRRQYGTSRYHSDLLPPASDSLDITGKAYDGLHGSTPELRALRSRILDSPGYSSALDVPTYLRSVDTRRPTLTPKRSVNIGKETTTPGRAIDFLNDDNAFRFSSPLLSGQRGKSYLRSRSTVPDLKIGSYTPYTQDKYADNNISNIDRKYDSLSLYKTSPTRSRINIHATDDILNRIKRGLSECESITKRLDRQYGEYRPQSQQVDYSERVFPRVLAENLFSNRSNAVPRYLNNGNANKTSLLNSSEEIYHNADSGEREQSKSTLARILENIKRIRSRGLFSDSEPLGKRRFVEVDKEELEVPRSNVQKSLTLDVEDRKSVV